MRILLTLLCTVFWIGQATELHAQQYPPVSGESAQIYTDPIFDFSANSLGATYSDDFGNLPASTNSETRIEITFFRLASSTNFPGEHESAIRSRLLIQMRAALDGLSQPGISQAKLAWLSPEHWEYVDQTDGGANGELVLQFGADSAVLCERSNSSNLPKVSEKAAMELRAAVFSVGLAMRGELNFAKGMASINSTYAESTRKWQALISNGYSQYPWESWINGYADPGTVKKPSDSQFIIMHPELSVIGDLRSSKHASADLGLVVHGLGYLKYDDSFQKYFGASLSMALPSDEELGLGYGLSLHYGDSTSLFGNLSLSVLYQEGTEDLSVALGMDLWKAMGMAQ
jgi:hypothetical protein